MEWSSLISGAADVFKTVTASNAQTSAANATVNAANANLQAQQLAQQNLQNQLLLMQQKTASSQSVSPTQDSNKTILWVSVGVGVFLVIMLIVVLILKRQ